MNTALPVLSDCVAFCPATAGPATMAGIERDLLARGIFPSVTDLARKIKRYLKAYSANAKPIQWKYAAPTRRIRTTHFIRTFLVSLYSLRCRSCVQYDGRGRSQQA